jgi:hypothetical protein
MIICFVKNSLVKWPLNWCEIIHFRSKFKNNFKSYRLVSTLKRIGEVDFLMKILATMSQLCTERSLESKTLSNFWDFTGGSLLSGDLSVHNWPIVANIFMRKLPFRLFWGYSTMNFEINGNFIYGTQYTFFWKVLKLHKKNFEVELQTFLRLFSHYIKVFLKHFFFKVLFRPTLFFEYTVTWSFLGYGVMEKKVLGFFSDNDQRFYLVILKFLAKNKYCKLQSVIQ